MRSQLARRVLVVLGYLILASWATWPLVRNVSSELPVGILGISTVPLFNVWTIWWNSDRILHGFAGYWNAPIFHPTANTFAFSETQPMSLIVAPVIWITGSRILAYNLYLLLSLVLNGVFANRLLRIVGLGRWYALGGGAAMVLLPIVHWQLDVLQLIPLWGILWTWTACYQSGSNPTWRNGTELAAAFSVTFFTCAHHGLFLTVLLIGSAWIFPRNWFSLRTWFPWGAAAIGIAVLIGPMIVHTQHVLAPRIFDRNPKLVASLSVNPSDYLTVTGVSLLNFHSQGRRPFWRLCPGWIKVGLALLAIVVGSTRRRWRRWTAFLALAGGLAFLLSLGPHLRLSAWQPWLTLTEVFPGFSRVRNVFRFAFFVQMTIILLAAQGLFLLSVFVRCFCKTQLWRMSLTLVLACVGSLAIFESRPAPVRLATVPDITANQNWVNFIRQKTSPGMAIACCPFPVAEGVSDFESATRWMYFGTFHHVPLVNGYSGFFTNEYFEIQDAIGDGTPSEATLRSLAESGVEFLVVNIKDSSIQHLHESAFHTVVVERVYQDPIGIEIYRLRSTREK